MRRNKINEMEELLRDVFETETDKIKGIEDIKVSNSQEILKKFEHNLILNKADHKRRIYKTSKKITNAVLTITMAVALFFVVSMSINMDKGVAISDGLSSSIYELKNGIFNMVASIGGDGAEEYIPYPIPMLVDLPADYLPPKIIYAQSSNFYYIDQLYRSNNEDISAIIIKQKNFTGKESYKSDDSMKGDILVKDNDIEILGNKGTITCIKSRGCYRSIIIWHDDITEYEIIMPLAEDDALELIKDIRMTTIAP